MWYLIVPPIIVVTSLAFLLWYLSRKSTDPVVAEKASHLGQVEAPVSFSRTKSFFLRMLEKTMQRSKVVSLRMHNALHERLQSVRERRQKIAESIAIQRTEEVPRVEPTYASEQATKREIVSEDRSQSEGAEHILAVPIVRHKKRQEEQSTFEAERPMVSDTVAKPEIRKRRIVRNSSREEALIGSIAANPKDFTAYEALGDYYLEIENAKDAKECYRQVLRLSPAHRMVKIKIRRLEKLMTEQRSETES